MLGSLDLSQATYDAMPAANKAAFGTYQQWVDYWSTPYEQGLYTSQTAGKYLLIASVGILLFAPGWSKLLAFGTAFLGVKESMVGGE